MSRMLVFGGRPEKLSDRVRLALFGFRGHKWMYDGASMANALETEGFVDATAVPAGETRIPEVAALDLLERSHSSVYVEAHKPR